jgi:DNA repair exonuclease SbcCD ATPase subunit
LVKHIKDIEKHIIDYELSIDTLSDENLRLNETISILGNKLSILSENYKISEKNIGDKFQKELNEYIESSNDKISILNISIESIASVLNTKYSDLKTVETIQNDKYIQIKNQEFEITSKKLIDDRFATLSLQKEIFESKMKIIESDFNTSSTNIDMHIENDKASLKIEAIKISELGNTLVPIMKNLTDLKTDNLLKEQQLKNLQENLINHISTLFDRTVVESIKNNINETTEKIKNFEIEKIQFSELINIYNFWRVGFSPSGIQSMLIDEAIPFMNSRSSEYLEKISAGRYSLSFDTMKETKAGELKDKINVNVFDTLTLSDARVKFSGGQERIIDIATILTLGDLQEKIQGVSFNILLFDEIFDTLDDENVRYVADLLKQISSNKTIVLISHRHINQIESDIHLNLN